MAFFVILCIIRYANGVGRSRAGEWSPNPLPLFCLIPGGDPDWHPYASMLDAGVRLCEAMSLRSCVFVATTRGDQEVQGPATSTTVGSTNSRLVGVRLRTCEAASLQTLRAY